MVMAAVVKHVNEVPSTHVAREKVGNKITNNQSDITVRSEISSMKAIELMILQRSSNAENVEQIPEAACKTMRRKSVSASLRPLSIATGQLIRSFCVWYIATETSNCIAPLRSTGSINITPKMVQGRIALRQFVQLLIPFDHVD